ncbi:hypothetical protein HYX06_05525 [Candidatus Woesearchaeota archaeon]|nr:hypothetical protein [Candidatus Woesearchaeota archaeon]
MKINKLMWISALVLIISLPLAFAQSIFDAPIFSNTWFIFFVNVKIVFFILFILQSVLIPKKEGKEKVAIWVICYALAVITVLTIGGKGEGYIWNVGPLSTILRPKVLVNALIIAAVGWFGAGFLGVNPQKKQGQIGLVLLSILIAGMIAVSIGDNWLWRTENYTVAKNYLLEPDKPDPSTPGKTLGGILRPEKANKYRLWVFFGSTILFAWFFSVFLKLDQAGGKKLTYFIAAWLGSTLARTGADYSLVIGMAQLFLIVIIASILTQGKGSLGMVLGWLITIVVVEYLFRTMFGASALVGLFGSGLCKIAEVSSNTIGAGYISGFFSATAKALGSACSIAGAPSLGAPSAPGSSFSLSTGVAIGKLVVGLVAGLVGGLWESITK